MKFETLILEKKEKMAIVTINRPDKLNALSVLVLTELKSLLNLLSQSKDIHGLILTGSGDKAFIAGADIKEMSQMTPEEGERFGRLGQEVTEGFERLPFPVIACVNGFALGGGCEMAMACDFIFATQNAVFGQPEVNLGLIPGFGGCVRLPRYVGIAKAKELIYSGRSMSAAEALRSGLANEIFNSKEEMMAAAEKMIQMILSRSSDAVAICKGILTGLEGNSTAENLEFEKRGFRKAFEGPQKKEGVAAFLEKRKPTF